jgi:hypothetical protein
VPHLMPPEVRKKEAATSLTLGEGERHEQPARIHQPNGHANEDHPDQRRRQHGQKDSERPARTSAAVHAK